MDRGTSSHPLSWLLVPVAAALVASALSLPAQPYTGLVMRQDRVVVDRFTDGYEATVLSLAAASSDALTPTLGDVDMNDNLDNGDSQRILNFFANIPQDGFDADRSDVDRNGTIDNADSQHALNYFAHIAEFMPVE